MPHLSPIIWSSLYWMVWFSFVLLIVSFEYMNFSLRRWS